MPASVSLRSDFDALQLRGLAKANADHHAANLAPVIEALGQEGVISLGAMAKALNERGMLTPRGRRWYKSSVSNLLKRLDHMSLPGA